MYIKDRKTVSIPLLSGQSVIIYKLYPSYHRFSFNPLIIGSICNTQDQVIDLSTSTGFNPLIIGSICNTFNGKKNTISIKVSIPLLSGQSVIKREG